MKIKTVEECFLEICNKIQTEKISGIDYNENIITSFINYSKLHNYEGNYMYNDYVILKSGIKLKYYFSNKRSYITIDEFSDTFIKENDTANYQSLLLEYIDGLFIKYKIDVFINSLNNHCK